jgi:hypothetical protein
VATLRSPQADQPARALRLERAAAMALEMFSSVCAEEIKAASNCDGARKNPRFNISLKKVAYVSRLEVFAPV